MKKMTPRLSLIKASITNYRSIEFLSLDKIRNFNLIIGKNSSGKSNIMRALEAALLFLKDKEIGEVSSEPDSLEVLHGFAQSDQIGIEVNFKLNDWPFSFSCNAFIS